MWVVCVLMTVHWRRERGGEYCRSGAGHESRERGGAAPVGEWKSEKTLVDREKA
jgi:hypothetical protein